MKEYIVFLDRATLVAELRIPEFDHTWVEHPDTEPAEVADKLWRASIAITHKAPITRAVIDQCTRLRLVAVAATGVDHVDLDACRERGIAVCNLRGHAEHPVPEEAMQALADQLMDNIDAFVKGEAKNRLV